MSINGKHRRTKQFGRRDAIFASHPNRTLRNGYAIFIEAISYNKVFANKLSEADVSIRACAFEDKPS